MGGGSDIYLHRDSAYGSVAGSQTVPCGQRAGKDRH